VLSQLESRGYVLTVLREPAAPEFLLPSGTAPTPGLIWAVEPPAGQISLDAKLTIRIQP